MKKDQLKGSTLFLIGGGPSLKSLNLDPLLSIQDRVLVSNNAYKLFPDALVAHHADGIWWDWHLHDFFGIYKGPYPTTAAIGRNPGTYPPKFIYLKREEGKKGFSENFPYIRGSNAGYQVLNIAYLLGAKRIILLGYDLKIGATSETQWHNEHKRETNTDRWISVMLPEFNKIAPFLKEKGIEVYNANLDSGIKAFEYTTNYQIFI